MEFEAPDWRALHSSLARRRRFAFCPVGYYLHHVPGRDGYGGHVDDWQYGIYAAKHCLTAQSWIIALWRKSLHEYFRFGAGFHKCSLEKFLFRNFEYDFALLENHAWELDPKRVNSVFELQERIFNTTYFYDRALFELNNIYQAFVNSDLYPALLKIPRLDFRCRESLWQWQLGGLNFVNAPDLVWKANGSLQILDMNSYAYGQEQSRAVLLYKVYAWRFMQIAPELVCASFFDPVQKVFAEAQAEEEDFRTVFQQLTGEAAMWRDYLIQQNDAAQVGVWNHARLDNCGKCKFRTLCPALSGTVLDDSYSK